MLSELTLTQKGIQPTFSLICGCSFESLDLCAAFEIPTELRKLVWGHREQVL